jgi:uncharacterized protein (DUF983 family)|tara:strand:+ start:6047 stop:6466 length:420 start_codon:yes stop_codon:yes gene_type:complete
MLNFAVLKKPTMQFLKGTKLYSVFTGTCPVCHKGKMYVEPNPYKLSKVLQMHDRCSHCDIKFKMEPSFFYGAMYVSYAVGVALAVAAFIIAFFFIGLDKHYTFLAIIGVLVIMFPIILRISRNIWINFFMKYDKEKAEA